MGSGRFVEAKYLPRPSPLGDSGTAAAPPVPSHRTKRQATVYDAVAGLVTTSSVLAPPRHANDLAEDPSTVRREGAAAAAGEPKRPTLRDATLPPDEVLFRRRQAPTRFAERDVYFAHESLPPGALPDGELLQAVHGYANRFYAQLGRSAPGARASGTHAGPDRFLVGPRHVDERSMEETALLAFGVLLEEAGREALGRRGDLVFTEGIEDETYGPERDSEESRRQVSRDSVDRTMGFEDGTFWKRSIPKRRKISRSEVKRDPED